MLGKLLKYEFKVTRRTLIPLLIAVPLLAFLAALGFMLDSKVFFSSEITAPSTVLVSLVSVSAVLMCIGVVAASTVVLFYLCYRFYKNFFGDEGYLAFTLPVSSDAHLLCKIISSTVWTLITLAVMGISIFCLLCIALAGDGKFFDVAVFNDVWNAFAELFSILAEAFGTGNVVGFCLEGGLLALLSVPAEFCALFLSVTVGSQIAKKHKLIASVGVFFGINSVLSLFSTLVFSLGITFLTLPGQEFVDSLAALFIHGMLLLTLLFTAAEGLVCYLVDRRLLKVPELS